MELHEAMLGNVGDKVKMHSSTNSTNTGITFVNRLSESISYYWFNFTGDE